ncbi:MAG: hypothetical protein V4667_09445 [Bacteroidota bacterium]
MKDNEVIQIINYLKKPNLSEDEIVEALQGFGSTGDKTAIPYLINELNNFESLSWKKRNAIAISLGELGADEAVPMIMDVIKNEKYKNYNGSFLYAMKLKPLNCKDYFLDFIELLCTGDMEIRESAVDLIEMFYKEIDTKTKIEARQILSKHKILIELSKKPREQYDTLGYIEHIQDLLN